MSLPLPGTRRPLCSTFAANLGPGQTGYLAHLILFFGKTIAETPYAQIGFQTLRADDDLRIRGFQQDALDHLATNLGDPLAPSF